MVLAAEYGSIGVFKFLLTCSTSINKSELRSRLFHYARYAGRLEIVQLLLDFQKDRLPWHFGGRFHDDGCTLTML